MSDKQTRFMCNQVLKVVKESNLNYLLNETPYSASVTVKKKFVKHSDTEHTSAVDDSDLSDVVIRQENLFLRQNLKGLESDKGFLKIKIEELELKLDAINSKNRSLEENIVKLESEKNSVSVRLEVSKGQLANESDKLAT